jgi:hypothetical protein
MIPNEAYLDAPESEMPAQVCQTCFATVPYYFTDDHTAWHEATK